MKNKTINATVWRAEYGGTEDGKILIEINLMRKLPRGKHENVGTRIHLRMLIEPYTLVKFTQEGHKGLESLAEDATRMADSLRAKINQLRKAAEG